MTSLEIVLNRAKRLIERNDLPKAIRLLEKSSAWFPSEVRLWRLLGVAEGLSENHLSARKAFARAVDIGCADIDVANLITTFWATEEVKEGIEILQSQFEELNDGAKEIVITSVAEAVRVGVLQLDWLPVLVRDHYDSVYGLS